MYEGPVGPVLGRKDCSKTDCLLNHPRGGQWFWFDQKGARQARDVAIVRDDTKVLYFCGDKPLETAYCVAGEIVPGNKLFTCPCKALEQSDDIDCDDSGEFFGGEVEGGTKCSKMCGGEVVEVAFCEHGDWTVDLAEVECFAEVEKDKSWTWVILLVTSVFSLIGLFVISFILCKIWRN